MAELNFNEQIEKRMKDIDCLEQLAGKGLMMPNNPTNSAPRRIMYSTQTEHLVGLNNPEPPLLQTGYENMYGKYCSSFHKADGDIEVLAKVSKYDFLPNHHYFLIVRNRKTGVYDVVERVLYNHITETYGYLYDNSYLDSLSVGSVIPDKQTYKKSKSFDKYDNRQDGVNLLTTYMSCETNKEDGIIISTTASEKLAAPLVKNPIVQVNDNDIPLNLYGDASTYKVFPNVGEIIRDGVICGLRREYNEESLFSQSNDRLRELMLSDDKITGNGIIADINIYCNNPEILENSQYYTQLTLYNDQNFRFMREFISVVENIKLNGGKLSYELDKMTHNFNKILNQGQYIKDKPFSNIVIEFIVLENIKADVGDKISNRYGGKGVIAKVLPDELMPKLENGKHVEVIFNSSGCVNRENNGQLIETTINHIGSRILDFIQLNAIDLNGAFDLYMRLLEIVSPDQYELLRSYEYNWDDDEKQIFMNSVINDEGISISLEPLSQSLGIDDIDRIYKAFEIDLGQYTIMVPQKDSNGDIRYIKSRRALTVGKQYIYRLKQYGEEKFSVVSMSATNVRNENSRSTSKKSSKSIYAKTPIRFGDMETGDLLHLGAENVVVNLMLHSVSPWGRRLCEEILTGDPFNVDIKLDDFAKNRSVEILNAYLLSMGLRLKFTKKKKQKKHIMQHIICEHLEPIEDTSKPIQIMKRFRDDEVLDIKALVGEYPVLEQIMKRYIVTHIPKFDEDDEDDEDGEVNAKHSK